MTEEERRFKILKIERYEDQISAEEKRIRNNSIYLGVAVIGLIYSFGSGLSPYWSLLLEVLTAGFTIDSLKDLIGSICKKTMFESKIEDINAELEMANKALFDEESRGKRR